MSNLDYKFCTRCGKPEIATWMKMNLGEPISPSTTGELPYCTCPKEETPKLPYGWVCPVCGKALAPWVESCDCVKPRIFDSNTSNWSVKGKGDWNSECWAQRNTDWATSYPIGKDKEANPDNDKDSDYLKWKKRNK